MTKARWGVIAPLVLIALVLAAVAFFDVTKGGEATPPELLGESGTPIRMTYVAPTPTPIGLQATATARPRPTTVTGPTVKGTPAERDGKRRIDLLLLLDAANRMKARDGSYPATNGNVQTICAFKNLDQGCKLKDVLGAEVPVDPLGDPVKNGYWYSSNGQSVKVYAALEEDVPDNEKCQTNDAELKKHSNVICIGAP